MTYRVPQGSILGPTIFLVYTINDLLCRRALHGKIMCYVDDTALLFSGKTWSDTYASAQKGFDIVSKSRCSATVECGLY